MELPKETLDKIEKEASAYCYDKPSVIAFYFNEGYNTGAKSEALRSLNEIEELKSQTKHLVETMHEQAHDFQAEIDKLNNQALHFQILSAKYQGEMRELESANKELMEALKEAMVYIDSNSSPRHERFKSKIELLLEALL